MQEYHFYVLWASTDAENYRYLGVTSRTVAQRFYGHKYCAIHPNKRSLPVHKWMYSIYKKGGTILYKEIHKCSEDIWREEEIRLIKEYKELGYDLLNLQKGGNGVVTKEMRDKSGIDRSINAHNRPIVGIDPTSMKVMYFFNSIKEAAEYFKVGKSCFSNALNQRTRKAKTKNYLKCQGYYWLYLQEYKTSGISNIDTTFILPIYQKWIYRFDSNGIFMSKHKSLREVRKYFGGTLNGLKTAILNTKSYRGFYWSFNSSITIPSKSFKYIEVDINNVIINKFNTLKEISEKYGKAPSTWSIFISQNKTFNNGNKIIKN